MVETINENEQIISIPYDIKKSIINIMFNFNLKLNGIELLLQDKLANKIEKAKKEILLEESDYLKIKIAFETITGYTRNDVELVQRILDAEEVEVMEK